ncbi:hypothetical protein Cgig2_031567 [Carnegiea gigantea]|uniref:Uncharacterized protein n=1 Tax=Carnegiea gigantea TaxID=171969 RepID=A0A9Q1Q5T2_9CARY|nr:hypothetical protein Cgig2_031567 [Carnegiea gigantea]
MPITASKLSKLECRILVEKIMGKVRLWSTRSLSLVGRAQLLNTVVFGMYNFWAMIFILPQEVIDQINQISRNYLWSGNVKYKRAPYISWSTICTPKKHVGLGLKNLAAWNKASVVKLVWSVAMKKDILWVKWFHVKYLKSTKWWEYKAPPGCSWCWKKIVTIKDVFKHTMSASLGFTASHYIVKTGNTKTYFYNLAVHPSQNASQNTWAKKFWQFITDWWPFPHFTPYCDTFTRALQTMKGLRNYKNITHVVVAATIYKIWRTRNTKIFDNKVLPEVLGYQQTRKHIIQRILLLNTISRQYESCIDKLLG